MQMDSPPFARGELGTGYATAEPGVAVPPAGPTKDTAGEGQLEGMEWVFPDMDYSQSRTMPQRSNRQVRCRVVRNTKAATLTPKRFVKFDAGGTNLYDYGNRVSDYASVGDAGGIVDEFLVAGPAQNDLFWLVIEGPSLITGDNSSTFVIGSHAVPGASGVAASLTPSATPATLYAQILGTTARVMQAVAAPTAGDIMCDVVRYR